MLLGLFLLSMDVTILNVAIPSLQRDLDPTLAQVQWIVDAFALVLGATVLSCGALTDRVGRRRCFLIGLTLSAVASTAGALSDGAAQVIAARAVMGGAAALMMPATLSTLTHLYPEPMLRRRAYMAWTMVVGLGGLAGPAGGGWLLDHFSWRAAFWANVPLAVLAAALAVWRVPESRATHPPRVDIAGTLLSCGGLLALVWAVIESPVRGWSSPSVWIGYALAAALLTTFACQQQRSSHPMLPPHLMRLPRVAWVSLSTTVLCLAMFGALFLVSLYLQGLRGYSPWEAGMRTLPMTMGLLPGAAAALPLMSRFGERVCLVSGVITTAVAFALLATVDADSSYQLIMVFQIVSGVGVGIASTVSQDLLMNSIPTEQAGIGSAITDATREIGATLGVAVLGSVFATTFSSHLGTVAPGGATPAHVITALTRTTSLPAELQPLVRESFAHALSLTCLLTTALLLIDAALLWRALTPAPSTATAVEPKAV